MDEILVRIPCPDCGHDIEVMDGPGGVATCAGCHRDFALKGRLCPDCGTYHAKKTAVCRQCHHPLSRTCDNCGASNWAGDETCHKCGTPLDIFSGLKVGGERPLKADWIEQINRDTEAASQKRMAGMVEKEEKRQADVARRDAKKKAEEQKMLIMAVSGLAVVVVIAIVFVLLF